MNVTLLADGLGFTEGPICLPDNRMAVVSMSRGSVIVLDRGGSVEAEHRVGGGPNGLALGPDGGLYVAQNGGIWAAQSTAEPGVQVIRDGEVSYLTRGWARPTTWSSGRTGGCGSPIRGNRSTSPTRAHQAPLVGQSLAYGDRRPYLVALMVLDQEAAAAWATSRDIAFATPAELATHPGVIAEIDRAVDLANEDLARVEQVKRYRVLPTEWTPEGGELTASLKIKRRAVHEKYDDVFDALYA
ncbi:long-chain fatty acid--CoA ligase [Rhodococcus oryzae]|uniref:Long-chain fatty acid--CoA ligase n=1 Tax=Rhodococcus oryzae TaxID=2571143 RepID=A0ABY2RGH3_9NOCA|nr:long-chain fatty acid--CoA ligase [Rhodococcus oryzae]TJZ75959.1 long-chain fatty acid--CoA ligase [Rhodococcus oryzae]